MTTFRCSPPGVDSKPFLKFLPSDFAIFKNLGKEAAPNGFPAVNRNDGASPIGMPQKVMAALRANDFEPEFPKGFDEAQSRDRREPAHWATATR